MFDIVSKRCTTEGCQKHPVFGPDFKDVSTEVKHQKLIETLKHWLTMNPSPLYLFYPESS